MSAYISSVVEVMVAIGPNAATGSFLSNLTDDIIDRGEEGLLFCVGLNASFLIVSADRAGGDGTTGSGDLEAHIPV